MVDWNPKEVMDKHEYRKFKSGSWVKVESAPQWVENATDQYFTSFVESQGHRPYDEEKVFNGDSLKYRVIFNNKDQRGRKIKTIFFAKIKDT